MTSDFTSQGCFSRISFGEGGNILAISRVENMIWQCFLLQMNSARDICQIRTEIIVASWHMLLVQEQPGLMFIRRY